MVRQLTPHSLFSPCLPSSPPLTVARSSTSQRSSANVLTARFEEDVVLNRKVLTGCQSAMAMVYITLAKAIPSGLL